MRGAEVQLVDGPGLGAIEVVVDLEPGTVRSWVHVEGVRPTLLFGEAAHAIFTTKEHPEYLAALAKRGITDVDNVQIDPWPAGVFGYDAETDRRIARCISFLRTDPQDNGYARPIEGLIVHFDLGRNEVIEVIDHGPVTMPTQPARYFAADNEPLRTDLKPIAITQPEGPSFTVDGNLVRWQKWALRLGFDPYEGLVLHQITYDDAGRERSILHRASITEMVVPYGDPMEAHGWKNAFDAGEWGLGRMTQSLSLGCDCLGEIHYFDAALAREDGEPYVIQQRHLHARGGLRHPLEARRPVRRDQRGATQPAPRDQLHLDGRQLRVRVLLVPLPRRQHPARGEADRDRVADGDRAGHPARVLERHRARHRGTEPPAPVLAPGSTSTSTAP